MWLLGMNGFDLVRISTKGGDVNHKVGYEGHDQGIDKLRRGTRYTFLLYRVIISALQPIIREVGL